jgi:ribosome-associated protein
MSRRAAPGRTPDRDAETPWGEDGRPSKSQLKRDALELQQLGRDLALLPETRLKELPMPEALREAVLEFRRTRSHEGRRRQLQFVGKQMRFADAGPLREAVAQMKLGPAIDSLRLHEAERWRLALIDDDEALTRWGVEVPGTDLQQLRTLVRNARAERKLEAAPGQGQRQNRAFRELFQFINGHLGPGGVGLVADPTDEDEAP